MIIAVGIWVCIPEDNDEKKEEVDTDPFISFYFYDNFQYDQTSGLLMENEHLAEGFWIKGYGDSKIECLKDACDRCGLDISLSRSGNIESIGSAEDSGFCVFGWVDGEWDSDISLSSEETYKVRFMAIGHGRYQNTMGTPVPPMPYQTPDDIKYYAEKPIDTAKVRVYLYDSYVNDPKVEVKYPNPSDLTAWIANGVWVETDMVSAVDAVGTACETVLGDGVNILIANGNILRIGDLSGNLFFFKWNQNNEIWVQMQITEDMRLDDDDCIAVGHGLPDGDNGPTPTGKPSDMCWIAVDINDLEEDNNE